MVFYDSIPSVKVSVIMACHNSARFLPTSIKSVINQTFSDIELIIVDDASDDESLSIARRAARSDSRIRVYTLESNKGACLARNIAIEKAKGEWIAILDADDVFLSEKISLQIQQIKKSDSDLVLIGTDSYEIDTFGKRFSHQKYPCSSEDLIGNLFRRKRFPPHSSLMYKTDIVRSIGCYNSRYRLAQDNDLWLRLSLYGSFASVNEPLVEYRHHDSNLSNKNDGFDQLKFGFAASICHFVRLDKHLDPSLSLSDADWILFLNWIANRLEQESMRDYLKRRIEWKHELLDRKSSFKRILRLSNHILNNPSFLKRVLYERFKGTELPEIMANEWIRQFGDRSIGDNIGN